MTNRKLFLDDVRRPPDSSWDVVRSYDSFVSYIEENGVPSVISFDHDLAFEHYLSQESIAAFQIPYDKYKEKTGLHCARYLIERGTLPQKFYVHSMNPVGAKNIREVMNAAIRTSRSRSFGIGRFYTGICTRLNTFSKSAPKLSHQFVDTDWKAKPRR